MILPGLGMTPTMMGDGRILRNSLTTGSGKYARFSSGAPFTSTSTKFTIATWIKPPTNVAGCLMGSQYIDLSTSSDWFIQIGSQNSQIPGSDTQAFIEFYASINSATYHVVWSAACLPFNAWSHLTLIYDSGQTNAVDRFQFWVNGVRISNGAAQSPSFYVPYQFTPGSAWYVYPSLFGLYNAGAYAGSPVGSDIGKVADVYVVSDAALPASTFITGTGAAAAPIFPSFAGPYYAGATAYGAHLDFADASSVSALFTNAAGTGVTMTTTGYAAADASSDVPG